MQRPKENLTPDQRRAAIADVFAKGILRLRCAPAARRGPSYPLEVDTPARLHDDHHEGRMIGQEGAA